MTPKRSPSVLVKKSAANRRGGLADGEAQVPLGERFRLEPITGCVDHARATAQVVRDVSRRERQRGSTQNCEHQVARCASEHGEPTTPKRSTTSASARAIERRGIGWGPDGTGPRRTHGAPIAQM